MADNDRFRDKAAVEHVQHAWELFNQNEANLKGDERVLPILLGMMIRRLDEIDQRLDTLEQIAKRQLKS